MSIDGGTDGVTIDLPDADLVVETDPDRREVQALEDRIYEFNAQRAACDDGELLAIFLRGQDGEVRGGLYGWTWSGCLEIRYLWIEEALRGRGYGNRLLETAEATARARGCHLALVGTHSFQAPASTGSMATRSTLPSMGTRPVTSTCR